MPLSDKCTAVAYPLAGERFEKSSLELSYQTGFDFSPIEVDTMATVARIEANKAQMKKLTSEYNTALADLKAISDSIAYLVNNMQTFAIAGLIFERVEHFYLYYLTKLLKPNGFLIVLMSSYWIGSEGVEWIYAITTLHFARAYRVASGFSRT